MRKRPIVQIDEDEGELIEKDRSHKVIRGGGNGRILKNVFKLKSRNLRYLQSTFLSSNNFTKHHIQKFRFPNVYIIKYFRIPTSSSLAPTSANKRPQVNFATCVPLLLTNRIIISLNDNVYKLLVLTQYSRYANATADVQASCAHRTNHLHPQLLVETRIPCYLLAHYAQYSVF